MREDIPYIIQGSNIVLVIDDKSHTINETSHINYGKILEAIKASDWDAIVELVDVSQSVTNYAQGKLEIRDGVIYWSGREFHNALATRILQMYDQGFPVEPMIKFMENLMENPSHRSVTQLYGFLEKNQLPITSDGCFLAYKRVQRAIHSNADVTPIVLQGDLVDGYSGKFRNNVGDTPSMFRNEVNDDPDQTCSAGLHFCSLSYLSNSGYGGLGDIVLVKINPKHVVSIPSDYDNQKGRCEQYEVVGLHSTHDDKDEQFFTPVVDEYDEFDEDFDEFDESELPDLFLEDGELDLDSISSAIADELTGVAPSDINRQTVGERLKSLFDRLPK